MEKVNVNGGAIAMGHPLGATGGMILGTLDRRAASAPAGATASPRCASAAAWASRPSWSASDGERTTIRWEQDDDGIVVLTLDDPNQSANTMNAAYEASMAATVDRLEAEKDDDHRRRHHLGEEDVLRRRRPQRPQARSRREDAAEVARLRARAARRSCAGWRRSASRSSPRSTAPRSAAAWRSRSPATTASSSTTRRSSLGFPEVQLGLLPGRRRRRAHRCACSASSTR